MLSTEFTRSPWSRKVWFWFAEALVAILVATGLVSVNFALNKQMNSVLPNLAQVGMPQSPDTSSREQDSKNTVRAGEGVSIDQLMGATSNFERSIALDNLLAQASFDDCLKLLDESKKFTETALRNLVLVETFRKLAAIDPEAALGHTQDYLSKQRLQLIQAVFQEWAFSDFDTALDFGEKYVQDLSDEENEAVLWAILQTRHDLSADVRRLIGKRFGQEYFVIQMSEQEETSALVEDPIASWHKLLENAESNLGESEMLLDVALAVIEKEGFDVFAKLHRALTDGGSRTKILSRVLRARTDVEGYQPVFDKAIQMIDVSNRSIVFRIAEDWANQDIFTTLDAIAKVTDGELREHLLETVPITWAEENPQSMLESSISLPEAVQNSAEYAALMQLDASDPTAAVKYLDRMWHWEPWSKFLGDPIDPIDRRLNIVQNLVRRWVSQDIVGAYKWLLATTHAQEFRHVIFSRYVQHRVSSANAEDLFDAALQRSAAAHRGMNEGDIVASVATKDSSLARKLVGRVRERPSRINAHAAIGAALLREDGHPENSLKYAEELPQTDHAEYFVELGRHWVSVSWKDAFAYIERLPSEEARSNAAFILTMNNKWTQALSDQQVEQLKPLLTEEQLNQLGE